MFIRRFLALLNARNKEFMRDRSSLSWNVLMPVLIVAGFAATFTGDYSDQYKVGVVNLDSTKNQDSSDIVNFLNTKYISQYAKLISIKIYIKTKLKRLLLTFLSYSNWIGLLNTNAQFTAQSISVF